MAPAVAGGLSVQFGSAVAALLTTVAGVLRVVTLRLVVAAVVLLVVRRPEAAHSRADWATVVGFGHRHGRL